MGWVMDIVVAYAEAWFFYGLTRIGPVAWVFDKLLGVGLSVNSLWLIFFIFNSFHLWNMWGRATGEARGWWEKLFGQNKWFSGGMFMLLIGFLRYKKQWIGFTLPPAIGKVLGWIGITSSEGSITIASFTKSPELAGPQMIIGGVLALFGLWRIWKVNQLAAGREGKFPLLGLFKRGPKVGAHERGLDISLYAAADRLAPLIEHEYKAVILKIAELEAKQAKGKRIDYKVLSDLKESKKDLEDEIMEYMTENEKMVNHPLAFKDRQLTEKQKAKEAFEYITRITLPRAKKYLKIKERGLGLR